MPLTESGRREWLGEIDTFSKRLTAAEENERASQSEYERMEWADQVFILRQYVRGMIRGVAR
jgi:hypothetical protein